MELLWSCFRVALKLLSCLGVALSGCGFEMESLGVTLESLEDLYHQNKNILVGFMLQTMSIYDDTKNPKLSGFQS